MGRPTADRTSTVPAPTSRPLLPSALLGAPGDGSDDAGRRSRTGRDWLVDGVVFVVAILVGAVSWIGAWENFAGGDLAAALDLASGLLVCGALWFRRRWPFALALLAAPVGGLSQAAGGATLILLLSVAVHRDGRYVAAIAAAQVPSAFVRAAIWPDESLPYLWSVLFANVVFGLVLAWGMVVRARRQLVSSLRERALRAEGEQRLRVDQARDHERGRIAREMHDVLAHRISLLSLHAGALEFRRDATPDEVAGAAAVIRRSAHEALEDLREVIGVLRTETTAVTAADPVRPQPGIADLPALLEESRAAGMRIDARVAVEGAPAGLVDRTIYRVVQEGLTNARKHAWGTVVQLRVEGAAGAGLSVEVRTPSAVGGAAEDPRIPGAGTGLIGLEERIALAGGRLRIGPTPDGGFLLDARLPWPS